MNVEPVNTPEAINAKLDAKLKLAEIGEGAGEEEDGNLPGSGDLIQRYQDRDLTLQEIEWMSQVAYLYVQLEKFEQAICIIRAILEFIPDHVFSLRMLAYTLMRLDKLDKSREICDYLKTLKIDDEFKESLKIIRYMIGQKEKAKAYEDNKVSDEKSEGDVEITDDKTAL